MENEWEFQGEVLSWINQAIDQRKLALDRATGEFPNTEGKRSDVIIWSNRAARSAVLSIELKTPTTTLSDSALLQDAVEKAVRVGAPYFGVWNMRDGLLYRTPADASASLTSLHEILSLAQVDVSTSRDAAKLDNIRALRANAVNLAVAAHDLSSQGSVGGQVIDATIFVESMTTRIRQLRRLVYSDYDSILTSSRSIRRQIWTWAQKQGLSDFVDDLYEALGGQFAYRVFGQVLFYFALKRHNQSLPSLIIAPGAPVLDQLRQYWNRVRTIDYEALYDTSPLEIIRLSPATDEALRQFVTALSDYDWNNIDLDVLGSVFEDLIPDDERVALGQYYTRPDLADLIISLCADESSDNVLDPGAGTGTFLQRAYDRVRRSTPDAHSVILERLWGFDISAFAAELAVIGLYRQDLTAVNNFPRVAVRDFFESKTGDDVEFPPPQRPPGSELVMRSAIPKFKSVIGNPPYVRSQQLDDIDPTYKTRLSNIATMAGVPSDTKFDAFAYFIVHARNHLTPGGRLGFVTSAAWLTAQYGAALQRFLLENFRLVCVIWSDVEPFFRAEVNTVVLVGELLGPDVKELRGDIRFVSLQKTLVDILPQPSSYDYWLELDRFVAELETRSAGNYSSYRVTLVDGDHELEELRQAPKVVRNWARPLLRSPIYDDVFGVES